MAIEKMNLAMCRGRVEQLDRMIWECCVDGNFHVESAGKYISESMGYKQFNEENTYKPLIQQLESLANLAGGKLEDSSMVEIKKISQRKKELIENFKDKIEGYAIERRELEEQKEKCEKGIAVYSNFVGLDVNVDSIGECEFIVARFGRLPKEGYLKLTISTESDGEFATVPNDEVPERQNYADNPYFMFLPCSEDATSKWGVYFAPKNKVAEIDRLFASLHFESFDIPGAAGTPRQIVENLKKDIEIIDALLKELEEKANAIWNENSKDFNKLYSVLNAFDKMFELKRNAVIKDGYFFFVGWVARNGLKNFKKSINSIDDVDVEFSTPEEDTTTSPPVKLNNLKIARPFEFFVEMYGLPGYNDVDITSFVAITYTLMFGIMFGDVGQGLILMIAGWLMWKLKKMALGKALIPCGISSMIFGFIYGSVFGYEEMLDPLYKAIGMNGKPLHVMESVNTILILAISIGIVLVTISIIINIYACLKRKQLGEALFSQNGVAGLLFYLCAVSLAVTFMSKQEFVPSSITVPVLIVCAVILFMKEILIGLVDKHPNWKPESISDFIMQNVFELLEYVLPYASNTVSFLRVGAFVLVHAGMMMVIFSLAGESGNIFVIALGNILIICLEGLLTGIQAMRLEFYEMFSRFYEGDGRPFNAVKINKTEKSNNSFKKFIGGKIS